MLCRVQTEETGLFLVTRLHYVFTVEKRRDTVDWLETLDGEENGTPFRVLCSSYFYVTSVDYLHEQSCLTLALEQANGP